MSPPSIKILKKKIILECACLVVHNLRNVLFLWAVKRVGGRAGASTGQRGAAWRGLVGWVGGQGERTGGRARRRDGCLLCLLPLQHGATCSGRASPQTARRGDARVHNWGRAA